MSISTAFSQADKYWSGKGTNDDFGTSGNWWNGNPSSGDNIYFNNTEGSRFWAYCNYGSSFSYFGNIISYSGAGSIKIYGDNIYAYKFENNNNGSLFELAQSSASSGNKEIGNIINNDLELNPVGSGGITINCDKVSIDNVNGVRTVKVYGSNTLTINAALYEKNGAGAKFQIFNNATVILNAQNLYTGLTTLSGGTLQLNRTGGNTLPSTNNVDIASGATLRVSSNQTLNKITLNGGTIMVDSGVTLTVGTIETTGGTISGSGVVKLTDVLTVSSGTFTTNNNVVLVSTANNTARVAPVGGTISGNVTVERYIPAKRAWRALTAPLKGSSGSLYATWQNNGATVTDTGVTIWGPSGTNIATGPNYSVLNYTATGWSGVSNTATTNLFDSTKNNAYLVFVTGAYGTNNITSGASATTLQATGQLITGNVSYSNIINTKHTLLGNPYASPINPAQMFTTGASNMLNYVWVWDPNLGTTGGYNMYDIVAGYYANTTSGSYTSNPAIQSGQGFFVKANSSGVGSFTLTESKKTTTVSNLFGKTNQTTTAVNTNTALFRVGLYKQENTLWTGTDGAMAVFYDAANNAVDDADGTKMENSTENIAFVRDAVRLSSEHHAFAQHQDEFFVKVWNTNVANYKLSIATENFQSTAMQATLHDLFLGTQTDLLLNGSVVEYPFEVTTNTASTGNRFKITFQNSALATTTWATQTIKVYPNPAKQGIVKLQLPQQDAPQLSYKLVNVLGQIMQSGDLQPAYNGVYEIPTQSLPNQNYILQVIQNQQVVATTQLVVQN